MNHSAQLLNFVYRNAEMGVDTLHRLLEIVEDQDLAAHLKKQQQGYQSFHQKAKELLNSHGFDEKGITMLDEIKTYIAINMQTMTDKSSHHLAEMVLLGSNMGIIDALKNQRKYHDAEENCTHLMRELQKFEEANAEELKKFI